LSFINNATNDPVTVRLADLSASEGAVLNVGDPVFMPDSPVPASDLVSPAPGLAAPLLVDRNALLAGAVMRAFETLEETKLAKLLPEVDAALARTGQAPFGEDEAEELMASMEVQNLLMYAGGVLYRV